MGTVAKAALTVTLAMGLSSPQAASAKGPPPAQDPSNCARADATQVPAYFPARKAPGQDEADGLTSTTAHNEVIAYVCMERKGRRVTLHYGWSSIGRLNVAGFNFRLMDCATGNSVEHTIRTMTYPRGTDERSARAVATFTIPKAQRLRPHLYGTGEYQRNPSYYLEGGIGRFNTYEEPKFLADGVCR